MKQRKKTILVLYSILLAAFSVYFRLDTCVIERVYSAETSAAAEQSAAEESVSDAPYAPEEAVTNTANDTQDDLSSDIQNSEDTAEFREDVQTQAGPAEPVITENSYYDGNISITITEYRQHDTDIYVADIQLSSADYLKTALAKGVYGRNVTAKTSATAAANSAVLAINGDYYGSQERGYVIRGGVIYRSTAVSGRQDLVIYQDGSMEVVCETDISAEELLAKGARDVLSFGPQLLEDGKITVNSSYEVARATNSNPRTAIGMIDELHYVFVVSDGRTNKSSGLTVYELAGFMKSLGVKTAYNLDGGGSSTMYFNGEVINDPVGGGRGQSERSVSDIVYIGY